MMKHRSSRGYSLTEILVVIAIIGILSLVTVPAFMNFQRRNLVRSALREFTATLRNCRQEAISNNRWIRLQAVMPSGEPQPREYVLSVSTDRGTTWTAFNTWGKTTERGFLPETMYFKSVSSPNGEVVFRSDGSATDSTDGIVTTTFVLTTNWKEIINEITVTVSPAGQIKSTESKS